VCYESELELNISLRVEALCRLLTSLICIPLAEDERDDDADDDDDMCRMEDELRLSKNWIVSYSSMN
jgi:hypothetical protein